MDDGEEEHDVHQPVHPPPVLRDASSEQHAGEGNVEEIQGGPARERPEPLPRGEDRDERDRDQRSYGNDHRVQRGEEKTDGGEGMVHREKRSAEDLHDLPEERR